MAHVSVLIVDKAIDSTGIVANASFVLGLTDLKYRALQSPGMGIPIPRTPDPETPLP